MLDIAKKRFSNLETKVEYLRNDYSKKPINEKFDLILSGLSIHHLSDLEKENLFKKIYLALNKNGLFINADQVLGETPGIDKIYRKSWIAKVKDKGVTEETLTAAFERMKEDKMATLSNQLLWLDTAGFSEINCWYKNYSLVVYSGCK